jgi:dihydroorotate dehydrogenase
MHADYVMVNISSPNTPGLRQLQAKQLLHELLSAVRAAMDALPLEQRRPLCVKIAPDLSRHEVDEIAQEVLDTRMDGVAVSNTTVSRADSLVSVRKEEQGGLSGKPLMRMSTEVLRWMYEATKGKIPLIGVGGVASAEDVCSKIKAGASLVQLYSALVYQGPFLVYRILHDLKTLAQREGVRSVQEWVGQG